MTHPISVFAVDDDPLVRGALQRLIERDPGLVLLGTASDGTTALAECRRLRPDVVVMDMHLGGGPDGIVTTRRLMNALVPPRVLAITSFDTESYLRGALDAGATGFLLKSDVHEHLTLGIRMAFDGDPMVSPHMTSKLITSYVCESSDPVRASARERTAGLTLREVEVGSLIGQGLTYDDIAAQLFISPHTVKAVVRSALPKVDAKTGAQLAALIATARLDLA